MSTNYQAESLVTILETALQQSRTLSKQIEEQARVITELKSENGRLAHELAEERAQSQRRRDASDNVGTHTRLLKDAQTQYEIDSLRRKLRTVKRKLQHCNLEGLLSSPSVPSHIATADPQREQSIPISTTTPGVLRSEDIIKEEGSPDDDLVILSLKRRAASNNKRKLHDIQDSAIAAVAEDGETFSTGLQSPQHSKSFSEQSKRKRHDRLGDLLTHPAPSSAPLLVKQRLPAASATESSRSACSTAQTEDPQTLPESNRSTLASCVAAETNSESRRSRFLRQPSFTGADAKLQYRPQVRSHVDDSDGARTRCLSGCIKKCCYKRGPWNRSALLKLPERYNNMSDNDVLRQYLGHGSDERIRDLTLSARENLLHDAKTKIIADELDRSRDDIPRRQTPPGYWETDFPPSQDRNAHAKVKS